MRALTALKFHELARLPPATEWFANIDNANTRRAYRNDLERRELAGSSIRRKLAALSSLFEYLSDANAVTHNPV